MSIKASMLSHQSLCTLLCRATLDSTYWCIITYMFVYDHICTVNMLGATLHCRLSKRDMPCTATCYSSLMNDSKSSAFVTKSIMIGRDIPGGYCKDVSSMAAIAVEHDSAIASHACLPTSTLQTNPATPPRRLPPTKPVLLLSHDALLTC